VEVINNNNNVVSTTLNSEVTNEWFRKSNVWFNDCEFRNEDTTESRRML